MIDLYGRYGMVHSRPHNGDDYRVRINKSPKPKDKEDVIFIKKGEFEV